MCGIAGIIQRHTPIESDRVICAMMRSLAHRGPDDEGIYIKENAALGHRRLSILDLSKAGHQPMATDDGKAWITYNGEIYNFVELKKELGEREYKGSSDTEVLLALYQKLGSGVVDKLNGIFAFAIWDENKKELFAARDHVGVKPFYYAMQNGTFYFASEIKALLAAGVPAEPNEKILHDYLVHGCYQHSHETFFAGIHQLPAGCALFLRGGEVEITRYWDLARRVSDLSSLHDDEVDSRFLDLFRNALTIQLRSDVPVGIQLSGGFDSSAITAMVHHLVSGQKNFHLFSHIYGEHRDIEVPYMQALADDLGWKIDFIEIYPRHMREYIEQAVRFQDEPFPGLPTIGLHMIAEQCRKRGIPVVLGGQGGDEIGAGYEYYMGAFLLDAMRDGGSSKAFAELQAYGKLHNFQGPSRNFNFFVDTLSAYVSPGTSADGTSFVKKDALHPEFLGRMRNNGPHFEKPFSSHLQNMQYRDIMYTKLPRILHSADRAAMAYGVEQRVPFVDYRFIEYGLSLPMYQKIRNGEQRHFMRRALKKYMPEFVRKAPKRAVPSPQREWFQKTLSPWIFSVFSSKSFASRPYFNQSAVLEEYTRYSRAKHNPNSFHIWQWLHLELWLRKYFD
ncbi:MAG: asparagine synthase (glutamine-hydrolyzing) [Candidatus Niyogibacteria bacterium]|nr:asparagine synthase (glutamine-hydrolyzing) [Candidatus Niyogibacteria bacterium]